MGFVLDNVVPWGRSYAEYLAMFDLSAEDLQRRILGCGDGPASFNAELTRLSGSIVSVDPVYQFSAGEIRSRINETYVDIMEQLQANADEFVWDSIKTPEELGQIRMAAMNEFLADFPEGLKAGRYVVGELPKLPFPDRQFDIALCSHFLFLYGEQLSLEFHIQSICELCRIAKEVRIFPLLELGSKESRYLTPVISALGKRSYAIEITPVTYEFQRGGNQMMKVWKK